MNTLIQMQQRPVVAVQPPPPASIEEYITKQEVARRLRKPVRTVDAWMREGIVPFYKVKHAVRFRWSEVQAHWAARYQVCLKRPLPGSTQEVGKAEGWRLEAVSGKRQAGRAVTAVPLTTGQRTEDGGQRTGVGGRKA